MTALGYDFDRPIAWNKRQFGPFRGGSGRKEGGLLRVTLKGFEEADRIFGSALTERATRPVAE